MRFKLENNFKWKIKLKVTCEFVAKMFTKFILLEY